MNIVTNINFLENDLKTSTPKKLDHLSKVINLDINSVLNIVQYQI